MGSSNARIAKNTLALYFRMILTLVVSLYTSRLVLGALGASDFGLYSLVGGVVALMGFLNATMVSSTQRFLNFEKGARDSDKVKRVFATSLFIHILLSGVILILAETGGLWLLNGQLNIEPDRMEAANWVYQCAVASFLISTVTSPYTAAIIANERMTAFAYMSLLQVGLRLAAVYILLAVDRDKLIAYAILNLVASIAVSGAFVAYSLRYFPECRATPRRDKTIFSHMLSFSTWSVISNLSIVLRIQGVNIVLNLFFGTLVNAAMGIAIQVNTAIQSFSGNFIQALNPQIVKNYASGDLDQMRKLVLNGCRLSFYLILLFSLPALMETEAILHLWLKNVPEHTEDFVRLILVQSLVESFAGVLATAQGATGNVRRYHLTLSTIGLMNVPLSYLMMKAGFMPYIVLVVAIVLSAMIGVGRVLFLRKSIGLPVRMFFSTVVARCSSVIALALLLPLAMQTLIPPTLPITILICVVSAMSVIAAVAAVGISRDERQAIAVMISGRLNSVRQRWR